jgi:hypothetical protein
VIRDVELEEGDWLAEEKENEVPEPDLTVWWPLFGYPISRSRRM